MTFDITVMQSFGSIDQCVSNQKVRLEMPDVKYWWVIVVYGYGQTRICGGGARWCYRKSRDRRWRQSRERRWRDRKWPLTGSDVSHMSGTGSMFCACTTGSCAISASFDRKWRQSRDRKRPWPEEALSGTGPVWKCAHAQTKVAQPFPAFFFLL